VELGDLHLAGILGRDLLERRGDHLARAAPLSPEVHHHGFGRVEHVGLKAALGYGDGGHIENSLKKRFGRACGTGGRQVQASVLSRRRESGKPSDASAAASAAPSSGTSSGTSV